MAAREAGRRAGTYRDISERPSLPSPFKSNIRSCEGQREGPGLSAWTLLPPLEREGAGRSPGARAQPGGRRSGLGHRCPLPSSGRRPPARDSRPAPQAHPLQGCGGCYGNTCSWSQHLRVPSPAATRGPFTRAPEGSANNTWQATISAAGPQSCAPGGGPRPLTMVWVYSWSLGSSYGRLAFFSRSDRKP